MDNTQVTKKQKWVSYSLLLLTAILWGSGFVPQKIGADNLSPFCFNALRYLIASVLILCLTRGKLPFSGPNRRLVILAGVVLFLASSIQQIALGYSTVGNVSFITTTYIVLVPFLSFLIFRKRISVRSFLAALLALVGLYFLSTSGKGLSHIAIGDIIAFAGSIFWALHILIINRACSHGDPVQFSAGQFLVNGLLQALCWVLIDHTTTMGLEQNWWVVVYSGIFVIGGGFTLQAVGQKNVGESEAAIILGLESVFGSLFGVLLLNESFTLLQLLGAGLIFAAVLLSVKD